jgi:elongation factor 1-beta
LFSVSVLSHLFVFLCGTDLAAMEKAVREIEMEGLTWGACTWCRDETALGDFVFLTCVAAKHVPVAFKLNKLQIMCTVVDDLVSVEDLQDKIQEFEDYVQSTDVVAFNKL